jgi:hypothetical protein
MPEEYQYSWDPKDWEKRGLQLIRARHGSDNVVRIPDKDRGDLGLEAYTYDGCAYQCYAPEHPLQTGERVRKVKAKIRGDIRKFCKHKEKLKLLFGITEIRRWVLLVPLLDSKEIALVYEKYASEVRRLNLPYVASEFRVLAADQSDFSSEIEQLRRRAALRSPLAVSAATDQDVPAWTEANLELAETLSGKLQRGFPNEHELAHQIRFGAFVKRAIDADNTLERLRQDMPDLWEGVTTATRSAEKNLEMLGVGRQSPRDILVEEVKKLHESVSQHLEGFSRADIDTVAYGAVSDWLMRCPLDFPGGWL